MNDEQQYKPRELTRGSFLKLGGGVLAGAFVPGTLGTFATAQASASSNRYALHADSLVARSVGWMDAGWDESAGLWLSGPDDTRGTTWYALGLLMRDEAGDRARAGTAIETVLSYQINDPESPYHGTWPYHPEDESLDHNWREFIGTALAIIREHHTPKLPAALANDIDNAILTAVEGMQHRIVGPTYTNIALMQPFLFHWAAERFDRPDWADMGDDSATASYNLFAQNNTPDEYNSPTYTGVSLYGLALWRSLSSSDLLRQLGAEMEAGYWYDIGEHYHADMKNLVGPYDRAYGIDMRNYATSTGQWIWMVVGEERAPFPNIDEEFGHQHDLTFAPCIASVGLNLPNDVVRRFYEFERERQVDRVIGRGPRVATSWLGRNVMIGGEDSNGARTASQLIPGTIHWKATRDDVGWIAYHPRESRSTPVDVRASRNRLEISEEHEGQLSVWFDIHAAGLDFDTIEEAIQRDQWQLPGLTVDIQTNAQEITTIREGRRGDRHSEYVEVRYTASGIDPGEPVAFVLEVSYQR